MRLERNGVHRHVGQDRGYDANMDWGAFAHSVKALGGIVSLLAGLAAFYSDTTTAGAERNRDRGGGVFRSLSLAIGGYRRIIFITLFLGATLTGIGELSDYLKERRESATSLAEANRMQNASVKSYRKIILLADQATL